MNDYTTKKRYCPHLLETKLHAVKIYRQTKDISFVCRRYHISKASLMRRNRAYDGTGESSQNKSHKPHTAPQCPHRTGIEVDLRLPPPESEHFCLRTVWQAEGRQSLQPSSRFAIPRICPSRIQEEAQIHKEKVQTHLNIRYTDFYRRKMANGRQICAECLLFRQGRAEILSIYGHRGSVPETVSLCI